jgi:hypothetical protein
MLYYVRFLIGEGGGEPPPSLLYSTPSLTLTFLTKLAQAVRHGDLLWYWDSKGEVLQTLNLRGAINVQIYVYDNVAPYQGHLISDPEGDGKGFDFNNAVKQAEEVVK